MSEADDGALIAQLRENFSPEDLERAGMTLEDMVRAASHPRARTEIAELMQREARSIREGEPAPDFELPWLSNAPDASTGMRLSDHFGVRPIALVFGSYT